MDSLEEMSNQGLVDKLIEYGVLDEGTTVTDVTVNEENASGIVKYPQSQVMKMMIL